MNWSFWTQFYDDALVGRDQNWPLLHEIATSDAIDSNAPAAEINTAIEDLIEINALKLSPIAEQMKHDPDDQKIYGKSLTGLTAQQTSDASQRVRDAIARLEKITPKGNYSLCGLISTELDYLRQDLDRYGHKPLRLYEVFFDCYVDLQRASTLVIYRQMINWVDFVCNSNARRQIFLPEIVTFARR